MADIADSISPGSTEYGERQVIEERIRQIGARGGQRAPAPSGRVMQNTQDRLQRPVSEKPITAGLSVGPGAGPAQGDPSSLPQVERYRILATEARNPYLRHLARTALRALLSRSS